MKKIVKLFCLLLIFVLLLTGCTMFGGHSKTFDNSEIEGFFKEITTASLETTTAKPTTTTTAVTSTTTAQVFTTTTQLKPSSPTTTTTQHPTTTRKPTTAKSQTKRKTTTTEFRYYMPTEEWERIKIKTFTFDYESEDYERFFDLVAKYCDEPNLKEYQVEKSILSQDADPKTGEWDVTTFFLRLRRYINGCETENTYQLFMEKKDGVYRTNTLSCWVNQYDPNKVKAPRKPTVKEEKAALKSEKERVQKEIDRQWPDADFVVRGQEIIYMYNIKHDYNYFIVQTTYGELDSGRGVMSAQFEIER